MQKSQLVEIVAAQCGITASESERYLNTLIGVIYTRTAMGETVNISGFGQFLVSHRASRIGVNPRQPSQKIIIPELNTPKFKAGEAFKKAVALKN